MSVRVTGSSPVLSFVDALDAAQWMAEELLGSAMVSRISVIVNFCNFKNDKKNGYSRDDYGLIASYGRTRCGGFEMGAPRPRFFRIWINNRRGSGPVSRFMQLRTLAHEMTHVRQFARDHMVYVDPRAGDVMWKRWREFDIQDVRAPHEREAVREEKRIYRRYKRHLREAARRGVVDRP